MHGGLTEMVVSTTRVFVPAVRARSVTDPNNATVKIHDWLVRASEWPEDIAGNANVRVAEDETRLNAPVYKKLRESIAGRDGKPETFHWRHRGIRVLASEVEKDGAGYWVTLDILSDPDVFSDGVSDGLTTSVLVWEAISDGDVHDDVLLPVTVIEGVPIDERVAIAEGLNSGVQPAQHTLANAHGAFKAIRERLEAAGMTDIVYREGDRGRGDVRDIVAIMAMFDVEQFDKDDNVHPLMAYTSKAACLKRFELNAKARTTMLRTLPILPEVLRLHDQITADIPSVAGTGAGHLRWISAHPEDAPFTPVKFPYGVSRAIVYPILSAFRAAVERKATGDYGWVGSMTYTDVLDLWHDVDEALVRKATRFADPARAASLTDVGKNDAVWDSFYEVVANAI
jgi:hypothetical protein